MSTADQILMIGAVAFCWGIGSALCALVVWYFDL